MERIINITSDGRVICDKFNMSFDEFYNFMVKHITMDYEIYQFNYDFQKKGYVATYKGIEYDVKHDNKSLGEVSERLVHIAEHIQSHSSADYFSPIGGETLLPDDTDLDRLVFISNKQKLITRGKERIEKCEKQKYFFNPEKPFRANDLNISDEAYRKLIIADSILSYLLMFSNVFGFFSPLILSFYKQIGSVGYFLSFTPFFIKNSYETKALLDRKNSKTLLYYLLYPILYLSSKKQCKEEIEMDKIGIKGLKEMIDDAIKTREKKETKKIEKTNEVSLSSSNTLDNNYQYEDNVDEIGTSHILKKN